MRDIERIDAILNEIRFIWTKYPDQRLGQILVNASIKFEGNPYYTEDDDLLKSLQEWRKNNVPTRVLKEK